MLAMNGIEDGALRLLRATREQLHGKPTRQVDPCEVAENKASTPTRANTTPPYGTCSTTAT